MPLERRDIASALTQKGFKEDDRDHDYYFLYLGNTRQTIYTKLSRGSGYRTIRDNLVGLIARQMMLTKSQLMEFVACAMTGPGYVAHLRAKGLQLREALPPPVARRKK